MPANTNHAPNFARSAIAPEIRATVIAANIPWKPTKTAAGMVPITASELSNPLRNANCETSPIRPEPLTDSPKTSEKPYAIHKTKTIASAPNDIIIMFSTLLTRTIPP